MTITQVDRPGGYGPNACQCKTSCIMKGIWRAALERRDSDPGPSRGERLHTAER